MSSEGNDAIIPKSTGTPPIGFPSTPVYSSGEKTVALSNCPFSRLCLFTKRKLHQRKIKTLKKLLSQM